MRSFHPPYTRVFVCLSTVQSPWRQKLTRPMEREIERAGCRCTVPFSPVTIICLFRVCGGLSNALPPYNNGAPLLSLSLSLSFVCISFTPFHCHSHTHKLVRFVLVRFRIAPTAIPSFSSGQWAILYARSHFEALMVYKHCFASPVLFFLCGLGEGVFGTSVHNYADDRITNLVK